MIAVGGWFLNDVLFKGGYCVVLSYLVMCYGDRVLGHLGGICVCVCVSV